MAGAVTASTVARFEAGVNVNLSIENDPGIYADGFIHLLLHPADEDVDVFASVGEVIRGDATPVEVRAGYVTFSGSTQAQLPKRPVHSSPSFRVVRAFDAETGAPATIDLHYDAHRNVLLASRPCHAVVEYSSYRSSSRRLLYAPKTAVIGLGVSKEFGAVAAFKRPNHFTVFEVDPFLLDQGNVVIELYRRYSRAIVIEENTYEYPTTIANNQGTYSNRPLVLDLSGGYSVIERPHEIGYMDEFGRGWPYTPFVHIREPYIGDSNYTPVIEKRLATLDSAKYPKNLQQKALDYIKSRGLYAD